MHDDDIVNCAECVGTGYDPDMRDEKCIECDGTGTLTRAEFRAAFPFCVAPVETRKQ